MKRYGTLLISILFLGIPLTAAAQTTGRFNPSIGISGSGNSFSGLSFNGVGGALLSCTNVGSSISTSLQGLFNKSGSGTAQVIPGLGAAYQATQLAQTVPTSDSAAKKELAKQSNIQACLNGVANAIAKNMLQQVTNRTLNFVNRGFDGNPLYVRDIDSYLKSIRDQKLNGFLSTVSQSDPIFGNALRSTITEQVTGYTDGRLNKVMNTPEAQQYQAFQNDFTSGGWSAFLNPKNNILGAYYGAVDNVSRQINTAQQNTKDELAQGNGFLSLKKCVEWSDGNTTPLDERLPGEANNNVTCTRYETVTPGKVIADQTSMVTTSTYRQLEQADQINEVLGAFFDQLLSRLFTDGLGGTTNGSSACARGSTLGCNVVLGSNGSIIASNNAARSALGYQSTTGGFNGDFDISRPQQLRAVIQTQANYLSAARDAQTMMNRIVPNLGRLDYCIPGPNPTWADGLRDNYSAYVGTLTQPSPDNPSFFQNLVNSIPIIGGLFGGTPKAPPILASAGVSLYDKVTDTTLDTKDRPVYDGHGLIQATTSDRSDPLFSIKVDDNNVIDTIMQYLNAGFNALVKDYSDKFTSEKILGTFNNAIALTGGTDVQKNSMIDAFKESSKLVSYNQAINEYNRQYSDSISQTEYALRELNDINTEVNSIVAGAKARYIKERAAAGNPVVQSCIDSAYRIDTSAIKATPRATTDSPDDTMIYSAQASQYFYSHLSY